MYRFAISYYIMNGVTRIPLSGVTIRLVRPGDVFENGVKLSETPAGSGYYETEVLSESFWGFYEVWDDRVDPNGSFSGKTCTVGKLDARGIKDSAIYSNHILNEAIISEKIANDAIRIEHIKDSNIPLSKLVREIQDQSMGKGMPSEESPPRNEDEQVVHIFEKEYFSMPHIILTPFCDKNMFIKDITLDNKIVTIVLSHGQAYVPEEWKYNLLVISSE